MAICVNRPYRSEKSIYFQCKVELLITAASNSVIQKDNKQTQTIVFVWPLLFNQISYRANEYLSGKIVILLVKSWLENCSREWKKTVLPRDFVGPPCGINPFDKLGTWHCFCVSVNLAAIYERWSKMFVSACVFQSTAEQETDQKVAKEVRGCQRSRRPSGLLKGKSDGLLPYGSTSREGRPGRSSGTNSFRFPCSQSQQCPIQLHLGDLRDWPFGGITSCRQGQLACLKI